MCQSLFICTRAEGSSPMAATAATSTSWCSGSQAIESESNLQPKDRAEIDAPPAHNNGRTALQTAVEGQHNGVVEMLLQRGAKLEADASLGRYKGLTALQAAAQTGNLRMVEQLLQAGASIDASGSYYNRVTALYAAAGMGHLDAVKKLITSGADGNATAGNKHWTALGVAKFNGHKTVVDLLERKV
ncbi:Ankyrin repeat-containing protein [Venturia nashicola]|nr:Ankyrin repeat-containing protein [Venturia nashicola]